MSTTTRSGLTGEGLVALAEASGPLTEVELTGLVALKPEPLQRFLERAGPALERLVIDSQDYAYALPDELFTVDWNTLTPKLRRLQATNLLLPAALLAHPTLESLTLRTARLKGPAVEAGPSLQAFSTEDCNLYFDRLTFGPNSGIRRVSLSLDEDQAESFVKTIAFEDTAKLESLHVHVEYPISFVFAGKLARLGSVEIWKQSYSSHRYDLDRFGGEPSWLPQRLR